MMPQELLLCWDLDRNFPKHIWAPPVPEPPVDRNESQMSRSTPSMRRPVDVKAHFCFLLSVSLFPVSQAASVAILPSALFL
jgi:hypothetical protein